MHKERLDHDILLAALPLLPNLKHVYFLQQEDYIHPGERRYWRNHSQSQRIKQLFRDWKPASDIYQAGDPIPELHREIWFHQALQWVLSGSQRRRGLESLVISGYKSANYERLSVPNLDAIDACILLDLQHLTLDFRTGSSSLNPWDDRWFRKAVRFMVTSSPHLKTLDIFAPATQQELRLGLLSILDWSLRYAQLQEIQLSFVTFDEGELRMFVDYLKHSLRGLTIHYPVFNHNVPWKDYVLSDADRRSLIEKHEPTDDELITYFLEAWGEPLEGRHILLESMRSDETGEGFAAVRKVWDRGPQNEKYHFEWPSGHVFAGASGQWDCPANSPGTLVVKWP